MRPRPRLLPLIPLAVLAVLALGACVDATTVPTGVDSPSLAQSTATDGTRGYVATLLPQLPGNVWSAALAINAAGVAVGFADFTLRIDPPDWYRTVCNPYMVATIFDHGSVRTLHAEMVRAIGGDPCYTASIATGINDRGDVVGTVWRTDADETEQGFFWSQATGVILHAELGPTFLTGVNGTGLVVGNNRYDGLNWHDFLWSPLGPPPPVVSPASRTYSSWEVNDAGRRAACVNGRAFTIDLDGTLRHLGESCGSPPSLLKLEYFTQNIGGGINAEGTMVFTNGRAPRRWDASSTRATAVGWSPGAAAGISDPGRIVGWRIAASRPSSVAMTVGPRGQPVVLPAVPGMTETEAYAVNACGDIVGTAFTPTPSYHSDRTPHAVIWTRTVCDKP